MSPMSAEATVVRNYLDWLLSIPWGKKSKVKIRSDVAEKVLDTDHLRPGKGQGADRRVSRRAEAHRTS
jgi:ATP-dependent Lon protease